MAAGGVAAMTVIAITDRLTEARTKLAPRTRAERSLPALAAALLAAMTALMLAGAVILGPGMETAAAPQAEAAAN